MTKLINTGNKPNLKKSNTTPQIMKDIYWMGLFKKCNTVNNKCHFKLITWCIWKCSYPLIALSLFRKVRQNFLQVWLLMVLELQNYQKRNFLKSLNFAWLELTSFQIKNFIAVGKFQFPCEIILFVLIWGNFHSSLKNHVEVFFCIWTYVQAQQGWMQSNAKTNIHFSLKSWIINTLLVTFQGTFKCLF